MLRYKYSIVALGIGVAIIILSTIPLALPQVKIPGFGIDKLLHGFAYFCFALSLFVALNLEWKLEKSTKWTAISVFSLGFLLEIIQGTLLYYRSFEAYDLLANALGIIFFIFLSKRLKKLLKNPVFL